MINKHQEWSKVEEEAHVEDSPELVDEAAELEETVASAWVWLQDLRLVGEIELLLTIDSVLNAHLILNFFSLGWELHISIERNVNYLADSFLDRVVTRKCGCIHIIESSDTCQCCITEQNKEVAVKTVQEDDGHNFKNDSQDVLDEAKQKGVSEADVPAVLFGCSLRVVVLETSTHEVTRVVNYILHRVESVRDFSGKCRVHVE